MHATSAETRTILADLNDAQRQAVAHQDGPLLVLAGPGSGKTRVITRRAAYLVRRGVPTRNILAITFTNKAADEMKQRIEALGVGRGMWVHTFHALGVRLLREFGPLAHVQPGFTIYDVPDQRRVIKDAMAVCGVSENVVSLDAVQATISQAKNRLLTPQQYGAQAVFFEQGTLARLYEAYEQLLEQRNAVDFDDLLMRVAIVLRDHPDVTERLNIRFRYLLIDEYQDTNHAQYLIAQHLSRHHRNICATGDPDQSIYGWRGADISNILEFERDYTDAVVVRLEQNYRSTGNILRVASQLISTNRRRKHKDLWTENGTGQPVAVWRFAEGGDEAERIAETIVEMHREGRSYSDFAIAYRINAISRGLEESLRVRGIPYKIARGVEFYNRKEIRDVLAYLRVLVNPVDQVALLRIINTPTRGIGKTTVTRLLEEAGARARPLLEIMPDVEDYPGITRAAQRRVRAFVGLLDEMKTVLADPVADAVSRVLTLSGLEADLRKEQEDGGEDRLANVQELVTAAAQYDEEAEEPTLADFLNRVSLTSDQDSVDESAGCVLLLTLHAAKGLEFPVVFIVGLEQGMLPHERSLAGGDQVEEERRLCFVGITRAQERLYLSHARERLIRGRPFPRAPSQFLRELDCDAIERTDFDEGAFFDDREAGSKEGFEPLHDHLPAEELQRPRSPKRRLRESATDADELRIIDVAAAGTTSPFADWKPGQLVRHATYGVGQLLWIRPGAGQSRAAIKFAGYGEKTFILELAPVTKLERGSV
ncbi:MAG: UvrD-helicase domain-containing protein [Planctomycetes bacterium]|nr:UvrD-helicase domain-containing protein [Planctomycetota bacterium]